MEELITVLMPVYNTKEKWLRLAIESILAQSYSNIEFLIVTDGPTDNSCTVIEEYAKKDNRIKVSHNEDNKGLIKTLNKGINISSGQYIARMDSDDIALPFRLESELRYLKANGLDLVGGRLQKIDENDKDIGVPTIIYTDEQVKRVICYMDCIPHPTWLVKKEVFNKLDGYREIKYCEDYDFLLRAIAHGYHLGMCDEVVLKYRLNTNGITRSNSLRQFLTANYIKQNLNRIEDITQDEIDNKFKNKPKDKEAVKFEKSIVYFRNGVNALKSRKILSGIKNIVRGLLVSRYAFINLHYIIRSNHAMHR